MTILCTLFDINYMDKGLALYQSLVSVSSDFHLFVLAMDDKCNEVLTKINLDNITIIKLSDFEDNEILKAKSNRCRAEYCWTCTPYLIYYILTTRGIDCCTYVDADIFFYKDPQIMIDEMLRKGASAQIVAHRFPSKNDNSNIVGKFCVQFNTFTNDAKGLEILRFWCDLCLETCAKTNDGHHFGDQKYLDLLPDKFGKDVNILSMLGGGLGPWNISNYNYKGTIRESIILQDKKTKVLFDLLFYHFERTTYIDIDKVFIDLGSMNINTDFVQSLYADYFIRLKRIKDHLRINYGINYIMDKHIGAFQANTNKLKQIFYLLCHPLRLIHSIYKKFCLIFGINCNETDYIKF